MDLADRFNRAALAALLSGWLPRQRWYAGKGRQVLGVDVNADTPLRTGDPALHHLVVAVAFEAGEVERYSLLLGLRASLPDRLVHAAIGEIDDRAAYDAAWDGELTGVLLDRIGAGSDEGGLAFRHTDGTALDTTLHSRVVGVEQSNTSLVYGDDYILKLFRKVAPGVNPELELTRALAEVGSRHAIAPLGWIEGSLDGEPVTFGLLQPFLRTGTDGWALATTSVRDLYAEADLHADEVGGDFAAESSRLGLATAAVHADLARVLPSRVAGMTECHATAAAMRTRLAAAVGVVDVLAPFVPGIEAAYDAVDELTESVAVQRVHGDYHLGQVLRVESGWMLIDFEGEPARPLAERRALMSPLRDVAGMLRSFDYAARHLLADHPREPGLVYRATEWAERNSAAFCEGYAAASGRDPRDEKVLLRAFELDKAVYEVAYEARHRPTWLPIPLGAVERLAG